MRILTRRMADQRWQFSCPVFNKDANGEGHAVYSAQGPERTYSLIAFAHDLPDEQRSDRVIAEAWDATFCLYDGVPSEADIERLAHNVPLQEAGRISEQELSLSRANRSVRLWSHVVDSLASGKQPDPAQLDQVGYLMRTTAVYGSGKFGAADRERIADRSEMQAPFQAEMLSVYLIRTFVRDLVQHMARCQGGERAVDLDNALARRLGIGNSTGLGMAPFIVNHPVLFSNWLLAREQAIARVRSVEKASQAEIELFRDLFARAQQMILHWHSAHPHQQCKLEDLRRELKILSSYLQNEEWSLDYPWHRLMDWAMNSLTEESQELLASLILEPYGDLVDPLVHTLSDNNADAFRIDGAMTTGQVATLISSSFAWALDQDWTEKKNCARAWYISEDKLEPRLGERFEEPIAEYEQPLAPARDAAAAFQTLQYWEADTPIAEFLLQHPEHRHTIRRAQISRTAPYSEIRDNTISDTMLPIDMLRAKLSFFGATRFDPRSDRWVRIAMYSGAPYPEALNTDTADFWVYPEQTE